MTTALGSTGARVIGVGVLADAEGFAQVSPPDHDQDRFEMGSITKVVTGTVLARLVLDGATTLDAPIGTWLDAGDNAPITLEGLATHTSGLPRLAPNAFDHDGFDESNPYACYDAELAEAGLRTASRSDIGTFAYSNFGYQVLGLCIERLTSRPLGDLYQEFVFDPAGMTGATADPSLPVLQGDDDSGPVANWTLLLQGPGGINATIHDQLALAQAVISPQDDRLAAALRLALEPRAEGPGAKVGLGWMLHPAGIACHGGGTAGFSTYIAADSERGRGVAVAISRLEPGAVQAVALAAALGQAPEAMMPAPFEGDPAPFRQCALDLFRCLADLDFEAARGLMSAETAEVLTADLLRAGWTEVAGACGDLREPTATDVTRARGLIQVTVVAEGSRKPLTLRTWLGADQQIAGVTVQEG